MKTFIIIILCIITTSAAYSQITATGVPFLLVGPSPEANGMASIASALPLDDPIAILSNPAQLGLQSLERYAAFSGFAEKTQWLPKFGLPDLTYHVKAGMVGINSDELMPLPFKLSLGAGYSRIFLNLGTILQTSPSGPEVIGTFHSYEFSDAYSIAIGIESLVKFGVGFNVKKITSHLSPVGSEQELGAGIAKVTAYDFGFLLNVPVSRLIADNPDDDSFSLFPNTRSTLDFSIAYARSNIGDRIMYGDPSEADPLPRYASVGFSAEYNIFAANDQPNMKIFSLAFARQAEDVLVKKTSNGIWSYQNGLGDINLFDGLILGEGNSTSEILTGWRMSVLELTSVRVGWFKGTWGREFRTIGFSAHLHGIWKILDRIFGEPSSTGIFAFLSEHVDGAVHYSEYKHPNNGPLDGTKFTGLVLSIR